MLELAQWLAFVAWAGIVFAMSRGSFSFAWHHFFIGLALFVLGSALSLGPLALLGTLVMLDDAVQHTVQAWRPFYRSPLHKLYGLAYSRSSLIRAVNRWLDGLFR